MRKKTPDLLSAYNAEVDIVYLEQAPSFFLRRNIKRDITLPNGAIERMLVKWQARLPT